MSPHRLVWPALALATLLFYSVFLFSPNATIHWDLADVSYPAQKYLADSIHAGHLPHWTPFLFSGMPFLSDPETGAWYPLHWPFFLIGITPRALAWELALHAFLALAGAFLFARGLLGDPLPAVIAAMFYAWGGSFAAHSSQLGMFEAAALLPWLLWAALSAVETGARSYFALTGLFAGLIILAGHFDAALYCFFALACLLAASQGPFLRTAAVVTAAAAIAFLLSAVVMLPWLEISSHAAHTDVSRAASLRPIDLANVMVADYWGVLTGDYKGPEEIRQFYLYGGLLLIPLAIGGLLRRYRIAPMLALVVPSFWYALGPGAGLAKLLHFLPGFRDVRAPVEIWFVPALGLAIAAGSGAAWFAQRIGHPRLPFVIMMLIAADLWHFNMYQNPLVFAHTSFEELYRNRQAKFESRLREIKRQPFYRLWASVPSNLLGPMDSSLSSRTEVAYGSGLLEMNRYAEYSREIPANPKLLDGVAAAYLVDMRGTLEADPSALPRISVPPRVVFVPDATAARAVLVSLDPSEEAVVEAAPRRLTQGSVDVTVLDYRDNSYRIRYSASSESLLRVAVPYAPGWGARVDQKPVEVLTTDYAFCGVIVPAGQHDLLLNFRPRMFRLGAALSLLGALAVSLMLCLRSRTPKAVR
ncbi:MAG: YfhO family protein [Bryobacteraceae bacterium]